MAQFTVVEPDDVDDVPPASMNLAPTTATETDRTAYGRPGDRRASARQGDRVPWSGVRRRRCERLDVDSVAQAVTARGASSVMSSVTVLSGWA